jgi:hypothetical protein
LLSIGGGGTIEGGALPLGPRLGFATRGNWVLVKKNWVAPPLTDAVAVQFPTNELALGVTWALPLLFVTEEGDIVPPAPLLPGV